MSSSQRVNYLKAEKNILLIFEYPGLTIGQIHLLAFVQWMSQTQSRSFDSKENYLSSVPDCIGAQLQTLRLYDYSGLTKIHICAHSLTHSYPSVGALSLYLILMEETCPLLLENNQCTKEDPGLQSKRPKDRVRTYSLSFRMKTALCQADTRAVFGIKDFRQSVNCANVLRGEWYF